LKKLKDVEGNEGKTIRLEAEVIGTPKPEIEWFVSSYSQSFSNRFSSFSGTKERKNYRIVTNILSLAKVINVS